jgi:hypothetical protein
MLFACATVNDMPGRPIDVVVKIVSIIMTLSPTSPSKENGKNKPI